MPPTIAGWLTPRTRLARGASWARWGVTAFCPTTTACAPDELRRVLTQVRAARATPAPRSARVLSAHLESNFISPEFRGAQPLLCLRSQSLGKMLMGLRIVTLRDGTPGGPLRAFLLRGLLTWVIECVPVVGKLYWLVDSFSIFREDQRCLHDLIAGTKVVRLK